MSETTPDGGPGDTPGRGEAGVAAPGDSVPSSPRRATWRRPAVVLAIVLDVIVVVGTLVALANGASVIVLALAAILAIAPWASIIDDAERPRR